MTARLLNLIRVPYPATKSLSSFYVGNRIVCLGSGCKSNPVHKSFSTEKKPESSVAASRSEGNVSISVGEAVKETAKTTSYLGIIIVGIGVTSVMFYTIFRELFSSKSPNGVYTNALKRCLKDNRVRDALGEPIKGFGEESRRGRRRYTRHLAYEKDGVMHMRMQFYVKGIRNQGTVHLEMKEDTNGDFKYRYLFVELDDYSRRIIVLEDNRAENSLPLSPPRDLDLTSPLNLS